jgi:hypothetical protein
LITDRLFFERNSSSMMAKLQIVTLIALAANVAVGQFNMLRFPCSQLVVERTDPLVFPGTTYTPHVHQIVGGNSFQPNMSTSHDLPGQSSCTSCSYTQDKSNYWTAAMYFHHRNGSYHRARQVGNGGPQGALNQQGGITMYYIPSGKVTAFAKVLYSSGGKVIIALTNMARASACSLAMPSTLMQVELTNQTSATAAGLRRTTSTLSAARPALGPIPLRFPRIRAAREFVKQSYSQRQLNPVAYSGLLKDMLTFH